ncbi:hypothetical protein HK099_005077 [Clydaea vesicula]|uniref:C2H2-type domain-containing protein n=1 Tax=Clydaea vesicula TaxID=447962 RepID=A0AAD5TZQ6_9FUNG|nr:hypothetical protein HK099_005077 [Clydaea vesicula]KAJ3391678.1 hypothetical protein HDU92_008927 [Lobulomyces angularis]
MEVINQQDFNISDCFSSESYSSLSNNSYSNQSNQPYLKDSFQNDSSYSNDFYPVPDLLPHNPSHSPSSQDESYSTSYIDTANYPQQQILESPYLPYQDLHFNQRDFSNSPLNSPLMLPRINQLYSTEYQSPNSTPINYNQLQPIDYSSYDQEQLQSYTGLQIPSQFTKDDLSNFHHSPVSHQALQVKKPKVQKKSKQSSPFADDNLEILSCPHENCEKTFTKQFNLKSHLRSHTTEKCFTCDLCAASFRRSHDLKRHIRSLHVAVKAFACPTCNKRFARTDALKRHCSRPQTLCNKSLS